MLIGGAGDDMLIGGHGDDAMIGGGGNDTFDPGTGNDIEIQSFVAGAGSEDRVDLRAISGLTFDWIVSHATAVDGNALLDLGNGHHVTLDGVQVAQLATDDFIFGP